MLSTISGLLLNPLTVILLIASGISATVGDPVSATIIIVIVVLGTTINFLQTYRSERAVEKVRQQVAPTAAVLRDCKWVDVSEPTGGSRERVIFPVAMTRAGALPLTVDVPKNRTPSLAASFSEVDATRT